jgi:hypothetical protein
MNNLKRKLYVYFQRLTGLASKLFPPTTACTLPKLAGWSTVPLASCVLGEQSICRLTSRMETATYAC